nr:uncharacterized protein LOC108119319 [Drosophila bipectinata]
MAPALPSVSADRPLPTATFGSILTNQTLAQGDEATARYDHYLIVFVFIHNIEHSVTKYDRKITTGSVDNFKYFKSIHSYLKQEPLRLIFLGLKCPMIMLSLITLMTLINTAKCR